jgi:hypothetical protein
VFGSRDPFAADEHADEGGEGCSGIHAGNRYALPFHCPGLSTLAPPFRLSSIPA